MCIEYNIPEVNETDNIDIDMGMYRDQESLIAHGFDNRDRIVQYLEILLEYNTYLTH